MQIVYPIDAVTNLLFQRQQDFSVLTLAEASCFIPSQFERLFKERMDINPKLFLRISRMTNAFRMKYNYPDLDWLNIALYCNYHDYQHLARDCKDLAEVIPTTYMRQEEGAPLGQFWLQDSFPQADLQMLKVTSDSIPIQVFNPFHTTELPIIIYYHPGGFITPLLPLTILTTLLNG